MKVAVRRISLASLGKIGCLLGAVAALLPSLLCGLAGLALAGLAHGWLESWQQVPIVLLGNELTNLDFVQLLGLEDVLQLLQVLTSASAPVLVLVVLVLALFSGVLLALIVMVVGLSYNLLASATGGLVVEMNAVSTVEVSE
jgi:hypothetical protein